MKNFKLGDRVTAIKKHECRDNFIGKKGTIITLEKDFITVEFDSDIKGNNGVRGNGKEGHCWNFWGEEGCSCLKKDNGKKIVITSDDDSIIKACLYEGKKNIASGIAKCHPKDEFDFLIGAELALQRLKESEKAVEPGDIVKIVNSELCFSSYLEWIKKNAPDFLGFFCYNIEPEELYPDLKKVKFTVLTRAQHEYAEQDWLLLIQDKFGRCFIINEKGVETIED